MIISQIFFLDTNMLAHDRFWSPLVSVVRLLWLDFIAGPSLKICPFCRHMSTRDKIRPCIILLEMRESVFASFDLLLSRFCRGQTCATLWLKSRDLESRVCLPTQHFCHLLKPSTIVLTIYQLNWAQCNGLIFSARAEFLNAKGTKKHASKIAPLAIPLANLLLTLQKTYLTRHLNCTH